MQCWKFLFLFIVYNLWVLEIAIVNLYTQEYVDQKYFDMENLTIHKYGWPLLPAACMNAELISNRLDPSVNYEAGSGLIWILARTSCKTFRWSRTNVNNICWQYNQCPKLEFCSIFFVYICLFKFKNIWVIHHLKVIIL